MVICFTSVVLFKGPFTVSVSIRVCISVSVTQTLKMGAAPTWDLAISVTLMLTVNRPINLHSTHKKRDP